MKTEMFNDEPLTNGELFVMMRESFQDDKSCWEAVHEAQQAYRELNREIILLEMKEEKEMFELYLQDLYAA